QRPRAISGEADGYAGARGGRAAKVRHRLQPTGWDAGEARREAGPDGTADGEYRGVPVPAGGVRYRLAALAARRVRDYRCRVGIGGAEGILHGRGPRLAADRRRGRVAAGGRIGPGDGSRLTQLTVAVFGLHLAARSITMPMQTGECLRP